MPTIITIANDVDGTYLIADDGTPANGTSVVLDPTSALAGTLFHPADSVQVISRAGQGVNLDITDSFTTASFTVGNLADPTQRPDAIGVASLITDSSVTLLSRGAISELNSDAATDISAATLLMRAGTGIGVGNAIETAVSAIEAESTNGGIFINNTGAVSIGGLGDFRGLHTGTTGSIVLTNQGSITISDTTDSQSIWSAGSVTLNAIGATSNITSNVAYDAITATNNIILAAGQDISLGTAGFSFDNDVRAGGSISIQAGRDFTIAGFADISADDSGRASGGGVSITAGRNIHISGANGDDASVGVSGSGGGSTVLTTGLGGTLTIDVGFLYAVFSGAGGVVLNTDRLLLSTSSDILATSGGSVTIATSSAGRAMDIGSASDAAAALEVSAAELSRITTSSLVLGSATTGDVVVSSALALNLQNLAIQSGGQLLVQQNISGAANVTMRAAGDIVQLGGTTITANSFHGFVDQDGAIDAVGGTASLAGVVAATSSLTGNVNNDTLQGSDFDNTLSGGGGNDTLTGAGGNDFLIGGAGADSIDGGADFDTASWFDSATGATINLTNQALNAGSALGDTIANIENYYLTDSGDTFTNNGDGGFIYGFGGADTITGGAGSEFIDGGAGADTIDGGDGFDYVSWNSSPIGVTVNLVNPAASTGVAQGDTVTNVEAFFLSEFDDVFFGQNGTNIVFGQAGADMINDGAAAQSWLFGGDGADILYGGALDDLLSGGAGSDAYVYRSPLDEGFDSILDFTSGADRFQMDATAFGMTAWSTLNENQFVVADSPFATTSAPAFLYSSTFGILYFDADGSGSNAAVALAQILGAPSVAASDFVFV